MLSAGCSVINKPSVEELGVSWGDKKEAARIPKKDLSSTLGHQQRFPGGSGLRKMEIPCKRT